MDWFLTVHQTGELFVTHRQADIYFEPQHFNNSNISCLELEFTAFRYFAVKLVYAVGSEYNETLIFRSMTPLNQSLRVLRTNVDPEMTKGHRFHVVLHLRSNVPGRMAVIRRLQLLPYECSQKGKQSAHAQTMLLYEENKLHVRSALP
jgi:hypothetical protein